ncbi:MAG: TetR/AcrR family transcriptional regulator [Eggerthellaceae bacterium]|nr:TetR/AcrR family transcriptional regulator [Eggerthellaceae bacterium]
MLPTRDQDYSRSFIMKTHIIETVDELCKERPLRDVSVREICKAAHISRQTFYRHFGGKGELSCWIVTRMTAQKLRSIGRGLSWEAAIVELVGETREQFERILSDSIQLPDAQRTLRVQASEIEREFLSILRERRVPVCAMLSRQIQLFSIIWSASFIEYTKDPEWARMAPDEFAKLISSFIPKEIKAALISS